MFRLQLRPQVIYADNGAQYAEALERYIDFLVASSEDPTALIHSIGDEPQGRGKVERRLALINGFLKLCPGFIDEENYRESLKQGKRELIYDFDFLVKELDRYVKTHNSKLDKKVESPNTKLKQGKKMALTVPTKTNLAVFAEATEKGTRRPRNFGFHCHSQIYITAEETPEMYNRWAGIVQQAKKDPKYEIAVLTFTFDTAEKGRLVYFSGDGERTWHLAKPKTEQRSSRTRQVDTKNDAVKAMGGENKAITQALQKQIAQSEHGPLVIDKFEMEFVGLDEPMRQFDDEPANPIWLKEGEQPAPNPQGNDGSVLSGGPTGDKGNTDAVIDHKGTNDGAPEDVAPPQSTSKDKAPTPSQKKQPTVEQNDAAEEKMAQWLAALERRLDDTQS